MIDNILYNPSIISDKLEFLANANNSRFTREAIRAKGSKIWVCHNHNNGTGFSQCISEYDYLTGSKSTTRLGSVTDQDDHNCASLVNLSNGKLFACYSEHPGNSLKWRISENIDDSTEWSEEQNSDPGNGGYVYTQAFEDSSNNIFMFFRDDFPAAIGGWSYIKSNDGGGAFSGYTKFIFHNATNRGYILPYQDQGNKDIIHFVCSFSHPDADTDNSIYHFYFNCSTETFHKSDGTNITANLPLQPEDDCSVIMSVTRPDSAWIEDIIVKNGNPRVLMNFFPNAKNNNTLIKDLYYSECDGVAWSTPYKIHTQMSGYLENYWETDLNGPAYPLNSIFLRSNPDTIIGPKMTSGISELFAITILSDSEFKSKQITFNSQYDQIRPISVDSNRKNLFWVNKQEFNRWDDWNTQIISGTYNK